MTNNLKAERTLTAEELQTIIDGCEKATPGPWFEGDKWVFVFPRSGQPTHALESIFRDVPETQENCLHVARLDPDTVKAMASMALQSLSTQQPMGEVTATMHKSDTETLFSKGWVPKLLGFSSTPLYASPQPEAVITEEMVERAMTRFYHDSPSVLHPITDAELDAHNGVFEDMRAALTAALEARNG